MNEQVLTRSKAAAVARPQGVEEGSAAVVAEFARLATSLDAAGLGPADYLYAPLKWRLEHRGDTPQPLLASVLKALRLVTTPAPLPVVPHPAAILAASSYSASADFLRKVVESFEPSEAVLCDASDLKAGSGGLAARAGALAAILPASIHALRVNLALRRAGASPVERRRITEAALAHAVYRRRVRKILRAARPECLVIANGNRPFEVALYAEAKTRRVATVLLPFAELNPKPARFLSLCRGNFDLALPFSDSSAGELRKLRADAAIEIVGFPSGLVADDHDEAPEPGRERYSNILYVCGNNFEEEASAMLHDGLADSRGIRLRVRLHPRNDVSEMRKLFAFVPDELISDPASTPLADDIAFADIAVMVRSTVALEAMFAGKPLIWLSPPRHKAEFETHPLRKQGLALFDASTAEELRAAVEALSGDAQERAKIAAEQWSRLRERGYRPGYYEAVKSALRRLVDWGPRPKTAPAVSAKRA